MSETRYIDSLKEDFILQCMHCGLCLPTCPTYAFIGREPDSPRGRIALMKAVNEGELLLTKKFTHHMYVCLECLACQTVCPAGVKYARLIEETRDLIEDNRKQPAVKKLILENYLAKPDKLGKYIRLINLYQKMGIQFLVRKSKALSLIPVLNKMELYLPELPNFTFKDKHKNIEQSKTEKKGRVAFFLGCVMNTMFPGTSSATIKILTNSGYDVSIPGEIKCCGAPHINVGDLKTAREFAKYNIDLFMDKDFENLDGIVTDCAGCGASLKDYKHYLEDDEQYREKAKIFSEKVFDINEFLHKNIDFENNLKETKVRVTYDDPCHLIHGQGVKNEPRELLKSIPGIDFVELPEADWCCGSAGTFAFLQSELSEKILDRKLEHVKSLNVDYLLTSNPGCLLQLDYGIRTRKLGIKVKHIMEFLAGVMKKDV